MKSPRGPRPSGSQVASSFASRFANPFGRRALLRGAFGAAVALPWLESLAPRRAWAQSATPIKRFIVMFSPNGTLPGQWTPAAGASETDFTLSPILAPLADHQSDLVVIAGLDQQGAGGDGHQVGIGGMLTGAPLDPGPFAGVGAAPAGWASGPSVDQRIAEAIGGTTKLRSLELGVQVGPADDWGRMCYRAAEQPLPPEDDPAAVYARVFVDLHTDPAVLAHLRGRRQSILDTVAGDYTRLAGRLGRTDAQRLQAHLQAVREIETSLTSDLAATNPACHDPTLDPALDGMNIYENDFFPEVGAMQIKLLVMALACDITRVASLQWSRSVSQTRFTWLGIADGHHDLSHRGDDDADAVDKLTRINNWYAQQLASLIAQLKAVPDGTGTLFDSTLILWCNELAKGNTHSRTGAPYVLAGGAGGALRTGRFLQYADLPHNNLLLSLLGAYGLPDTSFGKPEWCTGPLTGLL
jgi:hypothetical protein